MEIEERKKIVAALQRLQRPPEQITLQQIADAAGVSVGTVTGMRDGRITTTVNAAAIGAALVMLEDG